MAEPTVKRVSVEDFEKDFEIKELKLQNEKLNLKIAQLKISNEKLQRALTSTMPQEYLNSLFISIQTRLIEGFERFVELNDTNTHIYQSYETWYSDVTQKMPAGSCFVYENHIFGRPYYNTNYTNAYFFSKNDDTKNSTVYGIYQDVNALDKGWRHEKTKYVLILHPTDRSKIVEMRKESKSEIGASKYHQWSSLLPKELCDSSNYILMVAKKIC